jgi:chaperonin GroES
MYKGNTLTFEDSVKLESMVIFRNIVLVVEDEIKNETDSGIYLPDSAVEQQRQRQGTVVQVGVGFVDDYGNRSKPHVKIGERVIYQQIGGDIWVIGGVEYTALRSEELLAVVDN